MRWLLISQFGILILLNACVKSADRLSSEQSPKFNNREIHESRDIDDFQYQKITAKIVEFSPDSISFYSTPLEIERSCSSYVKVEILRPVEHRSKIVEMCLPVASELDLNWKIIESIFTAEITIGGRYSDFEEFLKDDLVMFYGSHRNLTFLK